VAELGTRHGALEHGQLFADQRERSKRDDERSHHELSCPAISHWINRGSDLILVNASQRFLIARNIGEGQGRPSAILDGRFVQLGQKLNF